MEGRRLPSPASSGGRLASPHHRHQEAFLLPRPRSAFSFFGPQRGPEPEAVVGTWDPQTRGASPWPGAGMRTLDHVERESRVSSLPTCQRGPGDPSTRASTTGKKSRKNRVKPPDVAARRRGVLVSTHGSVRPTRAGRQPGHTGPHRAAPGHTGAHRAVPGRPPCFQPRGKGGGGRFSDRM